MHKVSSGRKAIEAYENYSSYMKIEHAGKLTCYEFRNEVAPGIFKSSAKQALPCKILLKEVDNPTSELFTVILCDRNFIVF